MKKIYLASASPRRREILSSAGLEFDVITPECDENIDIAEPGEYVSGLSLRKAQAGLELLRNAGVKEGLIIGADTIVVHEGKILGKPADEAMAYEMLRSLSGKTHTVYTGVALIDYSRSDEKCNEYVFYDKTDVTFYDIPDDDIIDYIKTGEPMDKAGAYGIQGIGCFLVKGITGDYYNVMGLPAARIIRLLKRIRYYE